MYKIKIPILEQFRLIRSDLPYSLGVNDFIKMVKGIYKPSQKILINDLIRSYLMDGVTENDKFDLDKEEITQLKRIKRAIDTFQHLDMPILHQIDTDIQITGKLELIHASIGVEIIIGVDPYAEVEGQMIPFINLFDDCLNWKAYCIALGLIQFNLMVVSFGEYRPYKFNFRHYSFYPTVNMEDDLIRECRSFIEWCQLNNLEKYITV